MKKPKSKRANARGAPSRRKSEARKGTLPSNFPIAGVGASAGGLEALERFLKPLPSNTGAAFVIVQHLDPKHESRLTEILSHSTTMPVAEAKEGMRVEPNRIYVIPPNKAISIKGRTLHLEPRRNSQTQYMPIDFFFRSLAADRRHLAIGIILSGTASDGAAGMRAIKGESGITFAQDPRSAKYSGMPKSSIASGAVDFVLSPEEIAKHLDRIGSHPYLRIPEPEAEAPEPAEPEHRATAQILQMLRKSFGVDFRNYKATTVNRRIRRRMALRRVGELEAYLDYVKSNPDELRSLFRDMFVGVTEFFRDPGMFKVLERSMYPAIMRARAEDAPIRVWVPGCSTGEEVYSIVISLLEFLGDRASNTPTEIFGTDANEEAISAARLGKYGKEIAANVGQARLRRYFSKNPEGYTVSKAVRDRCVFAKHDITRDAPFRNLDLLSCRNLLIYLNPSTHQRLIPLFHFTLKPTGYLVLGSAETVGGFGELFHLVERRYKIYSKKITASRPYFEFPHEHERESAPLPPPAAPAPPGRGAFDLHRATADQILLSQHGPPAVLVNENMGILHFRGQTSPFLEPAQGAASLNLLKMAREGLLTGLEKAVNSARNKNAPARQQGLRVSYQNHERIVDIDVLPILAPGAKERTFLIIFEEHEAEEKAAHTSGSARTQGNGAARRLADSRVVQLKQELAGTKAYLQSVIENQEVGNEELRSLNEEIQSSNEELQSTTEELETANEELQSANEELNTLNEELQHRSADLGEVNTRLQKELTARQEAELRFRAMVESAPDVMVFADADGKIALVNGQTETVFGYQREELIGRPVEMLVPERFRKKHVSHRANYMKDPQARPMGAALDLWGLRKDGTEFPIEVNLSPPPTKDGDLSLVSSIIRDVSRQKALAERAKQAALLEQRTRAARDLHDTLAQGLTGIVLQLETAEEKCQKNSPEAIRYIARGRELARSTLNEARASVRLLSSTNNEDKDLVDSIRQLVERFRSQTSIRMEFSQAGKAHPVPGNVAENLVRVAQQAITNTLEHSRASRIQVELKFNGHELRLRVSDDGQGFIPSAVNDGFGIQGMRERIAKIGGKFKLTSKPGKGTRIDANVPVAYPADTMGWKR